MEKFNWQKDPALTTWLCDSAPAPQAVTGPKFYSQYKFVIRRNHDIEIKKFVPSWALPIVCKMLDTDNAVRDYFYELTYKGNLN